MKYKLKNGMEVDLHDEDMKAISHMYKEWEDEFDAEQMKEYFHNLMKHAVAKMQMISESIITDEDSIDKAAEKVIRYGTNMDFVKFMRYARDYDIAYHSLESFK